jgi:pullulanase/glycogen debranching enzyme
MKNRNKKLAIISTILSILIPIVLGLFVITCKEDEPDKPNPIVETQTPFADVPDLSEMVIYEVNPLAFDPDGTLADVQSKLDHFKSLGTNVIWLMPIYPKGELNGVGSPYCVRDYTSVNPDYGTVDDLGNLVDAAHNKGMAVILDWVANHTSWDNDWIGNEGWYVKDSNGNIIIPP